MQIIVLEGVENTGKTTYLQNALKEDTNNRMGLNFFKCYISKNETHSADLTQARAFSKILLYSTTNELEECLELKDYYHAFATKVIGDQIVYLLNYLYTLWTYNEKTHIYLERFIYSVDVYERYKHARLTGNASGVSLQEEFINTSRNPKNWISLIHDYVKEYNINNTGLSLKCLDNKEFTDSFKFKFLLKEYK